MASKWVRGRVVVVGGGGAPSTAMELLLHLEEVLMYNHSLKGSFRGSLETQREPGYLDFFLCFYSVDTTNPPPGHPTLTTTPDHLLPTMGLRSLLGGG